MDSSMKILNPEAGPLAELARVALESKLRDEADRARFEWMWSRVMPRGAPQPGWFLPVWSYADTAAMMLNALNPNAYDGLWVARLAHDIAEVDLDGRTVTVPMYELPAERAAWRRRKWWGKGPIRPRTKRDIDCYGDLWCARTAWCDWPNCLPF